MARDLWKGKQIFEGRELLENSKRNSFGVHTKNSISQLKFQMDNVLTLLRS